MAEHKDVKPHIYLGATGKSEPFTVPSSRRGRSSGVPAQNRQQHSGALRTQLQSISAAQAVLSQAALEYELESRIGIQVAFESFPGVDMPVESLADAGQQIELMNVRQTAEQILASVFVPEGKLHVFESKLQAYLEAH